MFTPATPLSLLPPERECLESLARAGGTPQKLARKCKTILLASEGVSNSAIAQRTGVSRPTVIATRAAFVRGGVEALREGQKRKRTRPVLTSELEQKILDTTRKTRPSDAARWSVRTLARHLLLSRTMVHGVWRRHGVQPRPEARRFPEIIAKN
jgi:transposase